MPYLAQKLLLGLCRQRAPCLHSDANQTDARCHCRC